jgi:hypothetical protein
MSEGIELDVRSAFPKRFGPLSFAGPFSFLLAGASHQNSPPSFQIECQLPETAHNTVAKVNVKLESKQNNESKTSVPGNRGAACRRWIVVRPVGLAHAYAPKIEYGRRR